MLCYDTAFAKTPIYLLEKIKPPKSLRIFWIPCCTSVIYDGKTWPERKAFEQIAFDGALKYKNYSIGTINDYMKNHIKRHYGIPKSVMVPFKIGIIVSDFGARLPEDQIIKELLKFDIPIDKKLIFTIGRCTYIKGHDLVMDMFKHLKKSDPRLHLVMLCPSPHETFSDDSYLQKMLKKNAVLQLNASIITTFEEKLPKCIYQWKNTTLVALLSRTDVQPLTAAEARIGAKNHVILTSNISGFSHQVSNGIDGFMCSLKSNDINRTAKKILKILSQDPSHRRQIVKHGKKTVRGGFDFTKNLLEFIKKQSLVGSEEMY